MKPTIYKHNGKWKLVFKRTEPSDTGSYRWAKSYDTQGEAFTILRFAYRAKFVNRGEVSK